MFKNHIIVIGASAGGISALENLLSRLPAYFPAAILIVVHIAPYAKSHLPDIISRYSKIPVIKPENGHPLEANRIYVAPPNLHMTISDDKIYIEYGPAINGTRPAIDPLFYSAAINYRKQVIGILLSGLLDDGSAGLLAIKNHKGIAIVQDLDEAEYSDMPRNALKSISIDHCLPTADIAATLEAYINKPLSREEQNFKKIGTKMEHMPVKQLNKFGSPSIYACPDCHGVLWQIEDEKLLRYRCRVGHTYGIESLAASVDKSTEAALWAALRSLEEKENLLAQIAEKAKKDSAESANYFTKKAELVKQQVELIRKILKNE